MMGKYMATAADAQGAPIYAEIEADTEEAAVERAKGMLPPGGSLVSLAPIEATGVSEPVTINVWCLEAGRVFAVNPGQEFATYTDEEGRERESRWETWYEIDNEFRPFVPAGRMAAGTTAAIAAAAAAGVIPDPGKYTAVRMVQDREFLNKSMAGTAVVLVHHPGTGPMLAFQIFGDGPVYEAARHMVELFKGRGKPKDDQTAGPEAGETPQQ